MGQGGSRHGKSTFRLVILDMHAVAARLHERRILSNCFCVLSHVVN